VDTSNEYAAKFFKFEVCSFPKEISQGFKEYMDCCKTRMQWKQYVKRMKAV
jgi:hypothetical protein